MTLIDRTTAGQFDKLPPHSIASEMCLLASMMLDKEIVDEVRAIVDRDAFFQADHQIIFDAILRMHDAGRPVDSVLLREELIRQQLLDDIGGVQYIAQILNSVPSAAHGVHYAREVAECHKLRELIRASNDTLRRAYGPHKLEDADAMAADLERAAAAIQHHGTADTVRRLDAIVDEVLAQKRERAETRQCVGLTRLDDLSGGLPIGGHTLVAGGAGMGKSQFIKQIQMNLATAGTPCGLISIEESAHKIGENMLANQSGVPNSSIVYNTLTKSDWLSLDTARKQIVGLPYYVDDVPMKLSAIMASAKRMAKKYGCKVIAVDHQHLIVGDGSAARDNREEELSQISGALKRLWKSLGVAGVVASQVNRNATQGEDTPPELRHLRGSGALEQDGDLIIMLHRPDYYRWKKDPNFTPNHRLIAYVNKNKGGPVGQVELYFDGDQQAVRDWETPEGEEPAELPWE
jgi:replicative DNA helicase